MSPAGLVAVLVLGGGVCVLVGFGVTWQAIAWLRHRRDVPGGDLYALAEAALIPDRRDLFAEIVSAHLALERSGFYDVPDDARSITPPKPPVIPGRDL